MSFRRIHKLILDSIPLRFKEREVTIGHFKIRIYRPSLNICMLKGKLIQRKVSYIVCRSIDPLKVIFLANSGYYVMRGQDSYINQN